MKLKKLAIKGVASLVTLCLLTGCDFSDDDDCVYFGTLKAELDWSHLKEEQGEPAVNDMNIVYYPVTGKAVNSMTGMGERFEDNPLIRNLNIGKYKFLFFNKATNPVKGLENVPEEGEIYSDLKTSAGKTFITTKQQFVYSLLSDTEEIRTDDTTYVKCNGKILVQKLIFNFNLKGMAEIFKVDSISAILDGVTTSRHLYNQKKGIEYASLHFPAEKTKEEKRYTSSVLVFGINNTPDNKVNIIVDFEGGGRGEAEVDLNDVLENFTADQKEIDIDVEILANLTIRATIRNWVDKDWGAIVLQ
ncbi:hypothetical protein [Massilibacteroides vaginae]|uniref:hypothetical protein n=1 Tax=Massilibacteroides vaginae TaxID=1673718 RepID=UPI000A1C7C09|nr:hypothetical protein [Massilibacteroides vaginae]